MVMRADDLSETERGLWMAFTYGMHIDLRTGDPEQDDPARASTWGPEREVRADVIRDLLVGRRLVGQQQESDQDVGSSPAVFLSGARITGALDLRGVDFDHPLLLQECAFEGVLVIADSMSRSVRLYGCHLPGVQGSWLKCAGDLHLRGCQIDGEVDLSGAYLGGQLVLSGSKMWNPGKVAVRGNGLVVAGDVLCRDFGDRQAIVAGEFRLVGARIGGELRFTNSILRNPGEVALNAERIVVEKDMYCRKEFRAEGEVLLSGGLVKGQLNFNDATLSNHGKVALNAEHLVVGSHLYCQGKFEAHGEINLVAAHVGGEVRFSAATLHNSGGVALRADRLDVADDMYCRQGFTVSGLVSLHGAHIEGQLNFNDATLSNPGDVALDADELIVDSHLYCQDKFKAEGEISLVAARVGGEVRFSASHLSNPGGVALRADRLFVAVDMYCRERLTIEGKVSLRSAHITGQLNFNNANLASDDEIGLDAEHLVVGGHLYCQDDFSIDGGISLEAARIGGEVRFSGASLSNPNKVALFADRLVVEKDMYCRKKLKIWGVVSLRGAHIGGNLSFGTTTISNSGGTAVQAAQLTVGNDFCCDDGFAAQGMLDLTDVHVNGELNFSKAKLCNPGDVALLAPRLIVDKDMLCRDEFTADGAVCLIGAHIGGKLSFTKARLTGAKLTNEKLKVLGIKEMLASLAGGKSRESDGKESDQEPERLLIRTGKALLRGALWLVRDKDPKLDSSPEVDEIVSGADGMALIADGLRVETDMTCDAGFTSWGEIRLKAARIERNLDFSEATVGNRDEIGNKNGVKNEDAFKDRRRAKNRRRAKSRGKDRSNGGIALNADDLHANRMLMPAKCKAGRISLCYGKMTELDDKRGVESEQIHILGLSYERLIPPLDPETRLEWLAKNDYEPQPYDQLARSYLQLGHNDKARKVQLEAERRRRKEITAPIRKPWGWVQDVTIGYGYRTDRATLLFFLVLAVGTAGFWIWPPPPMDLVNPPYFNPFFYTLDVLIPFADFGDREKWNSTLGHEWFKIVLAVFGWTLAVTAIAGINRALRRD